MGKFIISIILIFASSHYLFSQFVNPDEDTRFRTTRNFYDPETLKPPETTKKPIKPETVTPVIERDNQVIEEIVKKRGNARIRYFQKMIFTFDGKIELIEPNQTRQTVGFIAYYNDKNSLISIQFDGNRPFEIFIKRDNNDKILEMLWRHNYNNFLKYDFILNRFFIKMHLFNFIRNNSSLEIPEFSGQKIKYYTIMNEDNHERMNFEGAVSLEIAQTTRNYYTVYHNENGQWHTANYYEKNQTGYKLLKVYYAIRYNNPEIRNLRIHTLDTNDNETIHLDRSFFYDYDDKNKVILWEKYLRLPGNEWETLYETWKFEWKDDKQITLSRVNIFTDDYLSSVFVAFHIKPFLIKSDHFAKQADYLESIGIGSGASTLFGGSISLFTPIFKCFFINIEISWDGMWKKIDDARYTLNIFSLTANAMYIIPFYQDIYAIGMYVGGGIGVASADYTQVYNLPAPNYLAKERASSSGIIFNIRLGFTIVWKDGIFGIGGIFFLGKLTDFKEGKGTLYYTPDKGLRVYDSNSAEAATATKAELNMYRFSFELFFGFRL